jgi:3-hydroxybutyryl-CoA dehydrogenase
MHILIIGPEQRREAWSISSADQVTITWEMQHTRPQAYPSLDGLIDLSFDGSEQSIERLKTFLPVPVLINSVTHTLEETDSRFIRINAWPGFDQSVIEASCIGEHNQQQAERLLAVFGKTVTWLPDQPGFITPRVVSMIINEAYLGLSDGISTRQEIDTAMKLGTGYPYGPFEWARHIGTASIYQLLQRLSLENPRYTPAMKADDRETN